MGVRWVCNGCDGCQDPNGASSLGQEPVSAPVHSQSFRDEGAAASYRKRFWRAEYPPKRAYSSPEAAHSGPKGTRSSASGTHPGPRGAYSVPGVAYPSPEGTRSNPSGAYPRDASQSSKRCPIRFY